MCHVSRHSNHFCLDLPLGRDSFRGGRRRLGERTGYGKQERSEAISHGVQGRDACNREIATRLVAEVAAEVAVAAEDGSSPYRQERLHRRLRPA